MAERKKVTIRTLQAKKRKGQPITMMTAYDYPTAKWVDEAGIDVILVGDSLGMVVLGYPNTLPVTMEVMLHHCKAVARGAKRALLVGDMPFMSYQVSVEEAVRNAGRFLQDAGMDAVKLEGGREQVKTVRALVDAGIPVMGHLGLTPQKIHQLGGFRVQGRTAAAAKRLVEDALALEEAGVFALVLEMVPAQVARYISERLQVPTIGIGAGPHCDGQVLVFHDTVGMFEEFQPRFVKRYAEVGSTIREALKRYREDVEARAFPGEEHSTYMDEEEWKAFLELVEGKA